MWFTPSNAPVWFKLSNARVSTDYRGHDSQKFSTAIRRGHTPSAILARIIPELACRSRGVSMAARNRVILAVSARF